MKNYIIFFNYTCLFTKTILSKFLGTYLGIYYSFTYYTISVNRVRQSTVPLMQSLFSLKLSLYAHRGSGFPFSLIEKVMSTIKDGDILRQRAQNVENSSRVKCVYFCVLCTHPLSRTHRYRIY